MNLPILDWMKIYVYNLDVELVGEGIRGTDNIPNSCLKF